MITLNQIIAKLAASPAVEEEAKHQFTMKEDLASGPVTFLSVLESVLGADGLNSMPLPGTKASKRDNNPEFVYVTVDGKDKEVSVYNKIVSSLPYGKEIDDRLTAMSEAKKEGGTVPAAYAEYKSFSMTALASERTLWEGRRSSFRRLFRTSVGLYHQMMLVGDVQGVECGYVPDPKTGEGLTRAAKCIYVMETGKPAATAKWMHMSVTGFLRLDTKAAKEAGGGYDALKATLERAGNEGGEGNADDKPFTVETMDGNFAAQAAWFEDRSNVAAFFKKLNAAGSDDLLSSVGDLYVFLHTQWRPKFLSRYETVTETKVADAA